MRCYEEFTLFNAQEALTATFTATGGQANLTSTAHGLAVDDVVELTTTVTLPAGLTTATYYHVVAVAANTFQLSTTKGGSAITPTNGGTGTHTFHQIVVCDPLNIQDFNEVVISSDQNVDSDYTFKAQGSISVDAPDFNSAQSVTNHWDYIKMIDRQDAADINGDDGVSYSTQLDESYEISNIDGNQYRWLSFQISSYVDGALTIKARCFYNDDQ